ncbi:hypothetical protein FRC18_012080 [Serendipita sp. 400]|nr:hypothetical protein FRC18_012080 [Serendipita sp. 400]
MYSTFQRLNNISTFITTCTLALLVGISLSTFLLSTTPTGKLSVAPVKIAMRQTSPWSARREEAAFFEFNIDADLRPLFHWNTKQVFVYLSAEYTNGKGLENEVVIWDRIVRRQRDARIRIENGQNKYFFKDHSGSFRFVNRHRYPHPLSLSFILYPFILARSGFRFFLYSTPDSRHPISPSSLPPLSAPIRYASLYFIPSFVVLTWIGAFMASGLGAPHLRWSSLPRTCVPVDIAELVEGENPRS